MVVAVAIVFIIIAIIAVRMIVTAINSNSQKALAEEETQGYTMVDSTELGEDGKPLQVPVPDGFSASQVPGETTVNGGFVIYEGEVDWSKIEDLDSYAEVAATAEEEETQTEDASTKNSNTDSRNSENNENSEKVNIENNNTDTITKNADTTTNEGNSEEVAEEEQNQDLNSDQAEIQEDSQENVTSEENEISQEQIDEENTQEEEIDTEQTDNTEENAEELEQEKNEIIKEEEPISDGNEEAKIVTMSEEGKEGIETLAEGEAPRTVFELQTSRNQYVWVPVKDVSRIYGIDSNGKLWGKLYCFAREPGSTSSRRPYWSEGNGVMSKPSKTTDREPDVTHYQRSYDVDGKLQGYLDGIEQYQMQSQEMEESYYRMIESVKKYGGFYIGRYETGDLSKEEAVVRKMNNNINNQTWYTMYEKSKNLEVEKENIETGMIWGSLWDETLQWLLESGAQIQDGEGGRREITESDINSNSSDWGNYPNAEFYYINASGETVKKEYISDYGGTRIPTGSAEYTKANNIYDLAGNVWDWTLEAFLSDCRVYRGGYYQNNGSNNPAIHRGYVNPTNSGNYYGCRSALYIK